MTNGETLRLINDDDLKDELNISNKLDRRMILSYIKEEIQKFDNRK